MAFDLQQQFDVGPEAGQRGPQLVAGVLDQGALGAAGAVDGGEHRVDRGAQPGDLVDAVDGDRAAEVHGDGHVLDRLGESLHGHEPGAGDGAPEQGRPGYPQGASHGEQEPEQGEGLVVGALADGDLDGAAAGGGHGEHQVGVSADGDLVLGRPVSAGGDPAG